ncbi:nicotinamide riboside transporter PnuC [Flavobacterium sp. CYK-55]|uniref:nicotinamide riboside transporter PnuC n=1 Tax=Flavobacterium sp. CYK-55 TaxID=2835529 RepID=UPI001BCE6241|nr:nicotinamide riboside transporter PnuC [Flavobacterium sp. CYK-55]MBS7785946.1 nicotinamide riboside transporter PnuC [Flavobacterium sp. CYK-55]
MIDFFLNSYKDASCFRVLLELIVFLLGIWSVWLVKKVNIWAYPTGLIATVITTYLLYEAGYLGDMMLNGYFSIMSMYGWYQWARKKENNTQNEQISRTNNTEKIIGILLFLLTIFVVFAVYKTFGYPIRPDNYIDMLSSGLFFTAMWYMAHKKIENWTLWIIGDIVVVPLYAYRGLGMLALQYLIFTILAIWAYWTWRKTLSNNIQSL